MKAYVLHNINDIRYEDVSIPEPSEGEVLVAVKAVGICGSDIPRIYQSGAHIHPLIPGHEFSGIVQDLGKGVESKWLGRRVGVFPLIPCGECVPCQQKKYEMCRKYNYIGSRRDGAFAEYVTVPVSNLLEIPQQVSFEEAAMLEPMAVAVHALRKVMPTEADTVVVCGLGTIGLLLTMFLKEAGINKLFVVGNKAFQKEKILELGLEETHYIDGRDADVKGRILELTEGRGADVFFECVGKNETVLQAIDLTVPAGRICMVGNPYTDMVLEKSIYWKILRNQLMVTGSWNSSFTCDADDDWHYVLGKLANKSIEPGTLISHRYGLEELRQGFEIMRDKTQDYVKIMATLSD